MINANNAEFTNVVGILDSLTRIDRSNLDEDSRNQLDHAMECAIDLGGELAGSDAWRFGDNFSAFWRRLRNLY